LVKYCNIFFKGFRLKGFILKLNRAKNEDMVVTILSEKDIGVYYRFYGARHSVLQLGYLIDFEIEQDRANFLPRVRNITHIGFSWLYDREKLLLWHRFISIFEPHFREVTQIDNFYFELLLSAAKKWQKQNSKRLIIESFIKILQYEGHLHKIDKCIICNQKIENQISFIKGLVPTHSECSHSFALSKVDIDYLFKEALSLYLSDEEVNFLSEIVLKGFN